MSPTRHLRITGLFAIALAVVLAGLVAGARAAPAPQFQIVDLGTLGGSWSNATDINNSGQVVGHSYTAAGELHAFSWTQAGGMVDLGTLGGSGSETRALDVNDGGQVVGSSSTVAGERHAFLWTQAGGMLDLGTLGGSFSHADAVNDGGQVVGWSSTTAGEAHAFSWTQAGGMLDLGTLGGYYPYSFAYDVNDGGQVVGEPRVVPRVLVDAWRRDDRPRDARRLHRCVEGQRSRPSRRRERHARRRHTPVLVDTGGRNGRPRLVWRLLQPS